MDARHDPLGKAAGRTESKATSPPTQRSGLWRFFIDRGGTFTDIVALRPDGSLAVHKVLSDNPDLYDDAALQGIRDLLGLASQEPIPPGLIDELRMGTTLATNALLEHRGEPTLLLITAGFADLLRIGYQERPDIFARQIVLPELLYARVAEVPERLDAAGRVVRPLDLEAARRALCEAYAEGLRAVAIVFAHGYRFPDHESQVAALARSQGFTQVSVSHEVSPLIKLVARGETTVADAYLSPVLRRYLEGVAEALPGVHLQLMQSSGGLTESRLLHGKDAILSDPAGGVIGAVRTAAAGGLEKIITFDMGGTSTDVAHFCGTLERSLETTVGGVRLRTPMLRIHTVAAGGGSICRFVDGRLRVGRDSAGADPGPASYRRGGPLTVTDCNVMVGKLQAAVLPGRLWRRWRGAAGCRRRGEASAGRRGRSCRGRRRDAWPRGGRRRLHPWRSTTWPGPSGASPRSAATTWPAILCAPLAAPADSTPALWLTPWASRASFCTPWPGCCRPTAWAQPRCAPCASAPSRCHLTTANDRMNSTPFSTSSPQRRSAHSSARDLPPRASSVAPT